MTTRSAARAAARNPHQAPGKTTFEKVRPLLFGVIVLAVLAVGAYLAFGDFLNRPATAAGADTINVQSSMAGFTPSEIRVKAGSTVTLDWWTQDAAPHLTGGVHTMISPELGLDEALPAESRRAVTWAVPDKPGTYDVWCDSCCGGKEAPQMHGKIVVEPSA
jgi:plastocyanin